MTVRILVIDDELARVEYKRQEFLVRWYLFPTGVFASKLDFTFISSQHVHSNRIENDVALAVAFVGQNPQHWGMVLLDMQFDHGTLVHGEPREAEPRFGLKIQAALEQAFPDLPILQFTAQTQKDLAYEGGHYLSKIDGTPDDLRNQLIERGRLTLADKRLLLQIPPDTVVASDATLKVYAQVYRLARTKAALLILGETGTGKTKLAEYFHKVSANAAGPFKTLDMPTQAPNLFESLLFGHEKGAFTGADKFSPGLFSEAGDGTLFLDEIGALSLDVQAKLLSVVENRTYRRLGAKQDEVLRCRLVAATQDRIDTDLSRKDLWARFQTVTIPPLRDRPEEIEPIAQHFLGHFQGLESKKGMEFSPAALSALAEQTNLRNSRDLEQVIQNAVGRLSSNSVVQLRDLNLTAPNTQPRAAVAVTSPAQVLAAVPSTESVLAAPVKKLIPEVVIERIALADVVKLMAQVAVPEADEDLRGVLSAFDEKCSRIRKELVLAALYSCRHKMSGKVNILSSMQLLANDESLKGTQAKRELKMAFGLPGSGPVNRQWLQQLVAEWIVRKNQSNDL